MLLNEINERRQEGIEIENGKVTIEEGTCKPITSHVWKNGEWILHCHSCDNTGYVLHAIGGGKDGRDPWKVWKYFHERCNWCKNYETKIPPPLPKVEDDL